jgi:hypothetical protein
MTLLARTFRPTDARSWDHREPENGGLPRAADQAALNSAAPRILDIGGSVEEEVRRALGGGIRGLAAEGAVHTDITKEGSEILPLSDPRNRLRVWGRAISSAR